jgi:hypothetical protein
MTQRSRWAFSRLATMASLVVAAAVFGAGSLFAQGTTGKIEGTVKDSSGAAIAGAQVLIVGSAYRATTDQTGYYFMNSVPAGVVTVRAQYIGYAPSEVTNVRVLAGQTMTVNPVLVARAIEIGGITVTAQQNPIVPRDQVTSKPTVSGGVVNDLPVDQVSQVLALEPGVVQGNRGLSIRGSRPGTEATYIDGVLVRDFNGGFGNGGLAGGGANSAGAVTNGSASIATVGTNALEEASVTTGAAGAAYGQAEGGVISMVTRAGGQQYHGSVSYSTDNVSGQVYGTGLNRIEASFGGPIAKDFTFYLATTLQGQQNLLRPLDAQNIPQFVVGAAADSVMVPLSPGAPLSDSQLVRVPQFVQYAGGCASGAPSVPYSTGGYLDATTGFRTLSAAQGGRCQSTRQLNANQDQAGFDAKLQYSFGSGSQFSVTGHLNRNQGLSGYPSYDPLEQRGFWALSRVVTANWNQTVAAASEHQLAFEAALSWQQDQYTAGFVQPSWMQGHQDPFAFFNVSNIRFDQSLGNFPITDQLIENLRLGNCLPPNGLCIPYFGRNDLTGTSAYRINPYGVSATRFNTSGLDIGGNDIRLSQETRLVGRASLDWQANRYNRVQAGFDFTNFTDLAFTSNLITQIFMNSYKVSPKVYGLYGQDRIDLGDVVIELGLRYDHLNSGIMYPRVPGRAFSDPIKSANITEATKLSTYAFNAQDSTMVRACDAAIAASDSTALSTCNFFKADPVDALSPTLRVSFPVTDRTGFRLSYSHQVQTPDVSVLASGTNSDLAVSNTNDTFARPVGFGKTIAFEFGVRHAFSDDMVLDVSAYNKDLVSEGTARTLNIYDPFIGGDPSLTNEAVNLYTSADFGNVRGIDLRLDRRFGSIFQGTISYTYQTAKNTGSDPQQYLNTLARTNSAVTGARVPPPQAILPSTDNRTHTIAGNLAATFPANWHSGTLLGSILENGGIYATFTAASGLPFTLMQNGGLGSTGPGNGFGLSGAPLEPINSSTMPWIKNVTLRLTKGFHVARRDLMVFADFRNLFNWKNLTGLYAETGDVVNQLFQNNQILPQRSLLTSDAGNLWVSRNVMVNGVAQSETGVDLSDCSLYPYASDGSRGAPDCMMLRQAEARWGNGDNFFSTNEITTAFNAWYNRGNGAYRFYNSGFNLRLGVEFNF